MTLLDHHPPDSAVRGNKDVGHFNEFVILSNFFVTLFVFNGASYIYDTAINALSPSRGCTAIINTPVQQQQYGEQCDTATRRLIGLHKSTVLPVLLFRPYKLTSFFNLFYTMC